MNSDNLVQLLQKSFRVTIGATASFIESLQDSQKRQENLSKLSSDWTQLAEEWEAKGEVTEREARTFVDSMLAQARGTTSDATSTATSGSTITTTATPVADPAIRDDLRELTAQIAAMREELERLKQQDSPNS